MSQRDILDVIAQYGNGMWRSLVAHFVRDEGAAGSNPVIPIGIKPSIQGFPNFSLSLFVVNKTSTLGIFRYL